jgi:hypothetical protein
LDLSLSFSPEEIWNDLEDLFGYSDEIDQAVTEAAQDAIPEELIDDANAAADQLERAWEDTAQEYVDDARSELQDLKDQYESAADEALRDMEQALTDMENAVGPAYDEARQRYEAAKHEFEQLTAASEAAQSAIEDASNQAADEFYSRLIGDDSGNTSIDGTTQDGE